MEDNYTIQQLIETKRFDLLSADEKGMVLTEITQEEYEARREVIENLQLYFSIESQNVSVNDAIYNRARAVLKQDAAKKSGIIAFPIPFYAVAAAILLLLGIFWLYNIGDEKTIPQVAIHEKGPSNEKIVVQHDTVTIEKPVEKIVRVPVIRYIQQPANDITINELNEFRTGMEQQSLNGGSVPTVNFATDVLKENLNKIGKSSSEQSELNQFRVTSY